MRPILRPGCHVLKRGDGRLQVGLDPARAVLLPDTDPVRTSLRLLSTPADRSARPDPGVLRLLEENRLLVDEHSLMPLLPPEPAGDPVGAPGSRGALSRAGVAAILRRAGDDGPDVMAHRTGTAVEVRPFGHPAGEPVRDRFSGLLAAAGLKPFRAGRRARGGGHGAAARAAAGHTTAVHGALVGVGEPDRELVDDWMRSGVPHLLVRLTEGCAVVGPFVVPGRTACLRCLDAHHTDVDPSWPLLVAQYAFASRADRPDGAPEPLDPTLATVALGWAARDLATYAEGRRPSTWSSTVRLDPALAGVEARSWLRHPACGCTWG